jgi:hypothetical protein
LLTGKATCRPKPNTPERSPFGGVFVWFLAERSVSWCDPCRNRPQAHAPGSGASMKVRPSPPSTGAVCGAAWLAAGAWRRPGRAQHPRGPASEGKRPFRPAKRRPKARQKPREPKRAVNPNGHFSLLAAVRAEASSSSSGPAVRECSGAGSRRGRRQVTSLGARASSRPETRNFPGTGDEGPKVSCSSARGRWPLSADCPRPPSREAP